MEDNDSGNYDRKVATDITRRNDLQYTYSITVNAHRLRWQWSYGWIKTSQ